MPWVDKDMYIGCGICVEECPVNVTVIEDEVAEIHLDDCIHCGTSLSFIVRLARCPSTLNHIIL